MCWSVPCLHVLTTKTSTESTFASLSPEEGRQPGPVAMVPWLAHTQSQVPAEWGERARPALQTPPGWTFPSPPRTRVPVSLLSVMREARKASEGVTGALPLPPIPTTMQRLEGQGWPQSSHKEAKGKEGSARPAAPSGPAALSWSHCASLGASLFQSGQWEQRGCPAPCPLTRAGLHRARMAKASPA